MKLTFLGADHEVTGSMHFLEAGGLKILIDDGMEQGKNIYKNEPLPVSFAEVDFILLTHAHIDHSGMIPLAVKEGFHGTVYCTNASMDLDAIMLLDSAHIQEQEVEYRNRKLKRAAEELVEPAYTVDDAKAAIKLFKDVPYGQTVDLNENVKIRFVDAGHLLGSASIEIWMTEGKVTKKIVFSGDIGNFNKPLIRDPQYITEADYVVMESTYGDRLHEPDADHVKDLARIIQEALDRGGNVIIPAFAVGRTQEMLYFIRIIKEQGLVTGHDGFPVYVDSPLAVQATHIFRENLTDCYDDETKEMVLKGINPLEFDNLILSETIDESKAINFDPTPKVILAASGMCDAGRIRHHLKYNLWNPNASVVFAGYQAVGTLGRVLQEGAETVRLFGDEIGVRAHIEMMGGMSSHADQNGLLKWISAFEKAPQKVFLVHGEDSSMEALSKLITEKTGYSVECPFSGSIFNLETGQFTYSAQAQFIDKETKVEVRNNAADQRLVNAAEELRALAEKYTDFTNEDKRKFTEDIEKLLKKYSG